MSVPHQGVEHVTVRLDEPEGEPYAVYVLAHGAGAALGSDFLEAVAPRIADRARVIVMRFNYAYAENMERTGRRRPPEKRVALLAVHRAALEFARREFGPLPIIAGGKSLGSRMSTILAAEKEPMAGLILLGYPLHPAGKPDRLRVEHFPDVGVPTLFVQGTRDSLADLKLVREALPSYGGPTTLHVIEGADHSFRLPKSLDREQDDVMDEIAQACADWLREAIPR